MRAKTEIIYPFFLECCQFTTDTFWEEMFENLAYGKTPYGTYIHKDFLCCNYKDHQFVYKIERKDPQVLYKEVYKLFTEKLSIFSNKEKDQQKIEFHQLEKDLKETRQDWKNIRKKNIKDSLYEKYVIDMKNKYSLSLKQSKYLLSIIIISITFKTITPADIVYKNNRIEDIKGIRFEKGKIIIKRSICSDSNQPTPETPLKCSETKMSSNWSKYLESLTTK